MATANLSLTTATKIHVVDTDVHANITLKCGAAVTAGSPMSIASTGLWQVADADNETVKQQVYVALHAGAIGEAVTGSKHCVIDGIAVGSLAYDAPIYLSDTAGSWSSGTPTGGNSFICGRVEPIDSNALGTAPDKVVRFCTL